MKRIGLWVLVGLLAAGLVSCNLFKAITGNFSIVFENELYATTYISVEGIEEGDPPAIVDVIPAVGQILNQFSPIFIYFNDMIDPDTVKDNVIVSNSANENIDANLVLSVWNGRIDPKAQLTITPINGWPSSSTIKVTVGTGLKDKAGNMLEGGFIVSRNTGTASTVEFTLNSYSFEDGDASVFSIAGRGGLFSFSDSEVAAQVDFSAIDGDKAVLLSTAGEWDSLLNWPGVSGSAIPTGNVEFKSIAQTKGLSRLLEGGEGVEGGGEGPPLFGQGEYSSFTFSNLKIPAGSTMLKIDYYFLSDEFMFFIGSEFDDVVTYSIADRNGNVNSDVIKSINSFDAEKTEAENGLTEVSDFPTTDELDPVFRTDLMTHSIVLGSLSGIIDLVLVISDVGDSAFNSYIIFDNIRFE